MNNETLLLIAFGSAFLCYYIEKKIAWIFHASSVCLLILLAMLLSQFKIIPSESQLYDQMQGTFLLLAIVLITLNFNIKNILEIPLKILFLFIIGACGSLIGGVFSGFIAADELGINSYKLAAQLTASYIGGLENASAMQKIIDIPNDYFIAAFAVDNIVTSLWIIVCIYYAKNNEKVAQRKDDEKSCFEEVKTTIISIFACFFIAFSILYLAEFCANKIGLFHKILWLSGLTLIVGQIPFLRIYCRPGYVIGAVLFSGFFFAAGAISDFSNIMNLPKVIIIMPFIIITTHAIAIIIAAKLLKIDRMALSITSQSLIGGPGTAVAVAQAKKYEQGISLGIILGVFGYSIANFLGYFVFSILQFLSPF